MPGLEARADVYAWRSSLQSPLRQVAVAVVHRVNTFLLIGLILIRKQIEPLALYHESQGVLKSFVQVLEAAYRRDLPMLEVIVVIASDELDLCQRDTPFGCGENYCGHKG